MDVGFWLCGRWILVGWMLDFGCVDVGVWFVWTLNFRYMDVAFVVRWMLAFGFWTLDFVWVDAGFWLFELWIDVRM